MEDCNGLFALKALRSQLDEYLSLDIISEGGHKWKASFEFYDPATPEMLDELQAQLIHPIPFNYEQFLRYSNGALLYYDSVYGQWGFRLYGTRNLVKANKRFRMKNKGFEGDVHNYIAFAESCGDADVVVFDTQRKTQEGIDCAVIDGDAGYPPKLWQSITSSFSNWFNYLVVAQGSKYWRWY